jgi:L-rhamnose mutarotase
MIRKAFRMSVHPDQHPEYERRHNPIWPELEHVFFEHGVHTYSIFLDGETSELFAYVEIEDEARWQAIATTGVCRRWWRYMREVMPSDADDAPVSRDLRQVFHLSRASQAM